MHGGKSTGAPKGKANGNFRRGRFTVEAVTERREMATLLREAREEIALVKMIARRCSGGG